MTEREFVAVTRYDLERAVPAFPAVHVIIDVDQLSWAICRSENTDTIHILRSGTYTDLVGKPSEIWVRETAAIVGTNSVNIENMPFRGGVYDKMRLHYNPYNKDTHYAYSAPGGVSVTCEQADQGFSKIKDALYDITGSIVNHLSHNLLELEKDVTRILIMGDIAMTTPVLWSVIAGFESDPNVTPDPETDFISERYPIVSTDSWGSNQSVIQKGVLLIHANTPFNTLVQCNRIDRNGQIMEPITLLAREHRADTPNDSLPSVTVYVAAGQQIELLVENTPRTFGVPLTEDAIVQLKCIIKNDKPVLWVTTLGGNASSQEFPLMT